MPVTIGNLTSNMNISEGHSMMLTEEMVQHIVDLVMARIREEQELRQEGEIRDRMSEPDIFSGR